MMGKTHEIGGALAAMAIITAKGDLSMPEMLVVFGGGMLSSIAPDLDHPKSKLSNANPVNKLISMVICSFTTHRNATHTLIATVVFGIIGYLLALLCVPLVNMALGAVNIHTVSVQGYAVLFGVSMFAGALSHNVFDTFNDAGVPWLKPFSKKRFRVMNITTSSTGEKIFATAAMIILAAWMVIAVMNMKQFDFIRMLKIW